MDYARLADDFWENGYLVVENFFDDGIMQRADKLIEDHFGVSPEFLHTDEFLTKSQTEVVPWFPFQDEVQEFVDLAKDERLTTLTDTILKKSWDSRYCMVMFSKAGSKGQAWHQDCVPDNPEWFNLNRLVYTHSLKPEIGGGTLVVPGSHKRGWLSVGDPSEELVDQKVLYPQRGTLVLLHGHTWHRVYPIVDEPKAYRFSVNYRAMPEGTPEAITDVAVYRNITYRFSTNEVLEERA